MRRSTGFVLSPALFETDYNLFLKLIWGCRMMGQAEAHGSLGEEMQGSRTDTQKHNGCIIQENIEL